MASQEPPLALAEAVLSGCEQLPTMGEGKGCVYAAALAGGVYCVSHAESIECYSVATGEVVSSFPAKHVADYGASSADAHGDMLATGWEDGFVRVHRWPDGAGLQTLSAARDWANFALLSGEAVVAGYENVGLVAWDLETGAEQARLGTSGLSGAIWSASEPDTALAASRGRGLVRWCWRDGPEAQPIAGAGELPEGYLVPLAERDGMLALRVQRQMQFAVRVLDLRMGRLLEAETPTAQAKCFSDGSAVVECERGGALRVWDPLTGGPLGELPYQPSSIFNMGMHWHAGTQTLLVRDVHKVVRLGFGSGGE